MLHVGNGRPGICDTTAIHRAGCPQSSRQCHPAVRFRCAPMETKEDFRKAAEPSHFGANRNVAGVRWNRTRKRCRENAIGLVIAAGAGTNVEALASRESAVLDR